MWTHESELAPDRPGLQLELEDFIVELKRKERRRETLRLRKRNVEPQH